MRPHPWVRIVASAALFGSMLPSLPAAAQTTPASSTAPIDVRPYSPSASSAATPRTAGAATETTALTALGSSTAATPQVSGPLTTTASSFAFNAADHNVTPISLGAYGYVEQEYRVTGTATVYDWQGTSLSVVSLGSGPYTTRILVRKPINPSRFSGTVIVEALNPSYGYDLDYMWAASHDYFLFHDSAAHGDAWVGVTVNPVSIAALHRFDATRYASLAMPNPMPAAQTCSGAATDEPGLEWDILSQVGALLKSNQPSGPLGGLSVQQVYATGWSRGANDLVTYANAFGKVVSLPNGKPVYDGYLMGAAVGGPTTINQCATWYPPGDPHAIVQPNRVPIIRVNTLSDCCWWFGAPGTGVSAGSTLDRRPDHDYVGDQFRLYEIPGSSHLWVYPYQFFPGSSQTTRIGATLASDTCPEQPGNAFPLQYFLNGAFANLDRWARTGQAPVRGDPVALNNPGTYSETFQFDQWGNVKGGVRSPYLDVPTRTYVHFSSGPGCGAWGHENLFSDSLLASLYGNGSYVSQVTAGAYKLLTQTWVTEADAKNIIGEAQRANVP